MFRILLVAIVLSGTPAAPPLAERCTRRAKYLKLIKLAMEDFCADVGEANVKCIAARAQYAIDSAEWALKCGPKS